MTEEQDDTRAVETPVEETPQEELPVEETEEVTEEDPDAGLPEETPSEETPEETPPAAPAETPGVTLSPEEHSQLLEARAREQAMREMLQNPHLFGGPGGRGPAGPAAVTAPQPDPADAMYAEAAKMIEESGGNPRIIEQIKAANRQREQSVVQQIQAAQAAAMTPMVQQLQALQQETQWNAFCQADPDLAAENQKRVAAMVSGQQIDLPLHRLMNEKIRSGEAGNWMGALKLARMELAAKKPATTPQRPAVPKSTVLAASAVGSGTRAVAPQRGIPLSLSSDEYARRAVREAMQEAGSVRRK